MRESVLGEILGFLALAQLEDDGEDQGLELGGAKLCEQRRQHPRDQRPPRVEQIPLALKLAEKRGATEHVELDESIQSMDRAKSGSALNHAADLSAAASGRADGSSAHALDTSAAASASADPLPLVPAPVLVPTPALASAPRYSPTVCESSGISNHFRPARSSKNIAPSEKTSEAGVGSPAETPLPPAPSTSSGARYASFGMRGKGSRGTPFFDSAACAVSRWNIASPDSPRRRPGVRLIRRRASNRRRRSPQRPSRGSTRGARARRRRGGTRARRRAGGYRA